MSQPVKKIDTLRAYMAAGDWQAALRLAASFPVLAPDVKADIVRGHEAYAHPSWCRGLGKDPQALIEAGKAALVRRYGGDNAQR